MKKIIFFFVLGVVANLSVNAQCVSNYTYTSNQANPFQINFTNTSIPNAAPTDSINYNWDFNDGQFSSQTSPIHTFNQPATYAVCLILTRIDSSGAVACSDTFCVSIFIAGNPGITCDAEFFWSSDTITPLGIVFTDSSTYQSQGIGNTVQLVWDFGDGNTDTTISIIGNFTIINHTYAASGSYIACIEMYLLNAQGGIICSDTICKVVNVIFPIVCSSAFTTTFNTNTPRMVIFEDSSNVQLPLTGVYSDSVFWDFGDGNLGKGDSLEYTYAIAGNYTVCHIVRVYDSSGVEVCADSSCMLITILPDSNNKFCDVDYIIDTVNSYSGNVFIWNRSTPANNNNSFINTYNWTFGDGTSSNQAYPSHVYTTTGDFAVCVTLVSVSQNLDSCIKTYCDTLRIAQDGTLNKALAGFTLNVLNPETITLIENELSKTQIFPNPASENVIMRFSEEAEGNVNWKLTDVKGSIVMLGSNDLNEEVKNISIDVSKLDAGMYILSIENNISVYHNKLEINRW